MFHNSDKNTRLQKKRRKWLLKDVGILYSFGLDWYIKESLNKVIKDFTNSLVPYSIVYKPHRIIQSFFYFDLPSLRAYKNVGGDIIHIQYMPFDFSEEKDVGSNIQSIDHNKGIKFAEFWRSHSMLEILPRTVWNFGSTFATHTTRLIRFF